MTYQQLLHKPVCTMDGEELVMLITNMPIFQNAVSKKAAPPPKNLEYGIAGIARIFNCSIPTANRIKKSGAIDGAISQSERKIVVDVDKALDLARKAYCNGTLRSKIDFLD